MGQRNSNEREMYYDNCKCRRNADYNCKLPKIVRKYAKDENIHLIINRQNEDIKDTDKSTYIVVHSKTRNDLTVVH